MTLNERVRASRRVFFFHIYISSPFVHFVRMALIGFGVAAVGSSRRQVAEGYALLSLRGSISVPAAN